METNSPVKPARRSKKLIITVIVVVAAAVVAFAILSPYFFTFHDSSVLGFGVSTNATSISQNQTLRVVVSVKNGLDFTNTLPRSGDWKAQNLTMGHCAFNDPYGVALYQGRYTLDNISSGTRVDIYGPGPLSCPVMMYENTFSLRPQQNISTSVDLHGYWTGGLLDGVLHPFLPGVYTLVAGDEWGHIKVLYFQVGGIALESFSLCPSDCTYPNPYLTGEIYLGGPSPLKTLQLIVNGTDEGVVLSGPTQTDVILTYKGGFQSPPVIAGDAYSLRFVATFEDGSTSIATTIVKA